MSVAPLLIGGGLGVWLIAGRKARNAAIASAVSDAVASSLSSAVSEASAQATAGVVVNNLGSAPGAASGLTVIDAAADDSGSGELSSESVRAVSPADALRVLGELRESYGGFVGDGHA